MKQPLTMSLAVMRDIIADRHLTDRYKPYLANGLGMIYGSGQLFESVAGKEIPYRLDDFRMGFVTRGELRSVVNLMERRITTGTMALLTPGCIVQLQEASPDLELHGMVLQTERLHLALGGHLPQPLMAHCRDFIFRPTEGDLALVEQLFAALWTMVHLPHQSPEALNSLLATQLQQISHLAEQASAATPTAIQGQHQRQVFERFIRLVNEHGPRHHQLSFYADRLCLSERYLGVIVREVSGQTAKTWIDQAITAQAKVMLRHSDKPIARIADELRFPNPSFFSKYFARLTGQTPGAYRQQKCWFFKRE